jgi:hypothetical protein
VPSPGESLGYGSILTRSCCDHSSLLAATAAATTGTIEDQVGIMSNELVSIWLAFAFALAD